jgi:hypothetical protein
MDSEQTQCCETLLCLRVVAQAEPGILTRVLFFLQNINIVPRRVLAERDSSNRLYVALDVFGLPEQRATMIAAKIRQLPDVLDAHWYRR